MHKIDTDTATENNEFTDGNEQATPPVAPTDLNAAWFNTVQRELCGIVTGFGGELDESEGYQNNSQIFEVLKKIGIKSGRWGVGENISNDVDTSSFDGHHVIFHSADSFAIGALKTGSVVIVIPYWGGEDAPESINVDYKTSSNRYVINKGQMMIGVVGNGAGSFSGAQLIARYVPMMFTGDGDMNMRDAAMRDVVARQINVTNLVPTNRFESGFVTFTATEDPSAEGLQDYQTWQLMENWTIGQVKRVYCTDAQGSGSGVPVFYNIAGNFKNVKFYPESYREFVCIGSYETSGGYTFAVLLVN